LFNWFGDTGPLTHGELDLTFLKDLTDEELTLAREMIRRNLKLRYVHIIQGVSALNDVEAAPLLRAMLDAEPSDSRRLTIAGALWKLTRDPVFPELLERAKASGNPGLMSAHLLQVLWLDDARSIDFLMDLLPVEDREPAFWGVLQRIAFRMPLRPFLASFYLNHAHANRHRFNAWAILNQIEFGGPREAVAREKWRSPSEFRRLRNDPAFRNLMTAAVHKWNAGMTNGR